MRAMGIGLALLLLLSTLAVAFLAYKRPKAYRNMHPVFIALTCCAAAFISGAYVGADTANAELTALIQNDDDLALAAQIGGVDIPLFEVMAVCTLVLAFLLALHLILQVVEIDDD